MPGDPIGCNDVATVADHVETVTLVRTASGGAATPIAAFRVATTAVEAAPSGGKVVQADADWLVELPPGELGIAVGDALLDDAGEQWTVLQVRFVAALGRRRCSTRNLRVALGLNDSVDVLRPVWQDAGAGPEIVGWDFVATAQPVRLQPLRATLDEEPSPPAAVAQFTATFAAQLPIEAGDRLETDAGERYVVEQFAQAERIDALPTATVTREIT